MYWAGQPLEPAMSRIPSNRAAQYIRMSTDHQDLSPEFQEAAIKSYASLHGLEIVASYDDLGRSGLSLRRRPGMRALLRDVLEEDCEFSTILVYDVPRWGRFEDVDASAYYDYHCRMNGVQVVYVAEPFTADGSPVHALLKGMKRVMAAEYIQDLRKKVKAGQARAVELGFQMGSTPCIGVRRHAVLRQTGESRALRMGERKCLEIERIRWVPGPEEEVALVRRIFFLYANTTITMMGLARLLAREGQKSARGRPISNQMIRSLLGCEALIGNFVWGRKKYKKIDPNKAGDGLLRARAAIKPIIDEVTWNRVQTRLKQPHRPIRRDRDGLLADLSAALHDDPALSCLDLCAHGCANHGVYVREFGSFNEAVRLAGADLEKRREGKHARSSRAHTLGRRITADVVRLLSHAGLVCCSLEHPLQGFVLNGLRVRVQTLWRRTTQQGSEWFRARSMSWIQDYALLVRINEDGTAHDFLLLNRTGYDGMPVWLTDKAPRGALQSHSAEELVCAFKTLIDRRERTRVKNQRWREEHTDVRTDRQAATQVHAEVVR